ncbi:hypothetical protein [Pectinatus sottacetonis]|uniref:hypothetical protein n=1 Tax=Pectinatus sottacetonis TaxID=1002795 RepID=UPI0018C60245|nr:hypothetical protein [Pectinatus sottacetonis]
MGRCLIKSPIISYFGDFRSEIYTEEYAAHANFNAWPLVRSLIMEYIGMTFTGHGKTESKGRATSVSKRAQNGQPYEININDYNLFGGPDEQGGFDGTMHIYLGGNNQGTDAWMVNQMNKDSVQEDLRGLPPAYKPFVSIVVPTAYIGKQSTIPETWIEMQNIPNRLGLGAVGEDANPAEVLFELHVNNDWGLGESEESLIKIGKTLSDEGVGISIQLSSKTEAKDLINNILTHINAYKFMDTATGKMSFKLVRDDYDPATAFLLDISNCSNVEFTRPD